MPGIYTAYIENMRFIASGNHDEVKPKRVRKPKTPELPTDVCVCAHARSHHSEDYYYGTRCDAGGDDADCECRGFKRLRQPWTVEIVFHRRSRLKFWAYLKTKTTSELVGKFEHEDVARAKATTLGLNMCLLNRAVRGRR